jgi:hypothetical protein
MRIYITFFLLLCLIHPVNAQLSAKFEFFAGYGYYEGFNAGTEYYFKDSVNSVSLSAGYARSISKYQQSFTLEMGYNRAIFKSHMDAINEYKWQLSTRLVYWQLDDSYYNWNAISLIPSLRRRFILCRNIHLSFDVGPAFNIVLTNKRKTYENVGWPYHVMPNFRILCVF